MPKHDCFIVALCLVMDNPYTGEPAPIPGAKIVHGLPMGTGGIPAGKRYWHGWVEATIDGVLAVIDCSNDKQIAMERDEYYRLGNIEQVFRYNRHQAAALYRKHGHAGPWAHRWQEMEDPSLWEHTRRVREEV